MWCAAIAVQGGLCGAPGQSFFSVEVNRRTNRATLPGAIVLLHLHIVRSINSASSQEPPA